MYYKVTFDAATVILPAKDSSDAYNKAENALLNEGYLRGVKGNYPHQIKTVSKSLYDSYHENEYNKKKQYAIIEY